ncbi:hypothetical protein ACL7TT_16755 [Microbulbifer sp. 2304DJ12-6]|uniref:hypothetical protein n=1 Tax=Microbulbifer sp. 2304DJ12-6 TaxID=3233340 RepID=UPI0039B0AFD2
MRNQLATNQVIGGSNPPERANRNKGLYLLMKAFFVLAKNNEACLAFWSPQASINQSIPIFLFPHSCPKPEQISAPKGAAQTSRQFP